MVRSIVINFPSSKHEKRLLALCINATADSEQEIEPPEISKWNKIAIHHLYKKLKDEPEILIELEKALSERCSSTKCVRIAKTFPPENTRLLVSHRRCSPLVIYCRLWRWPDLQSHHQLRAISSCESKDDHQEYHFDKANPPTVVSSSTPLVCVNPYHYERKKPASLAPVLVPRSSIPPDLSTSLEESDPAEHHRRKRSGEKPSEVSRTIRSILTDMGDPRLAPVSSPTRSAHEPEAATTADASTTTTTGNDQEMHSDNPSQATYTEQYSQSQDAGQPHFFVPPQAPPPQPQSQQQSSEQYQSQIQFSQPQVQQCCQQSQPSYTIQTAPQSAQHEKQPLPTNRPALQAQTKVAPPYRFPVNKFGPNAQALMQGHLPAERVVVGGDAYPSNRTHYMPMAMDPPSRPQQTFRHPSVVHQVPSPRQALRTVPQQLSQQQFVSRPQLQPHTPGHDQSRQQRQFSVQHHYRQPSQQGYQQQQPQSQQQQQQSQQQQSPQQELYQQSVKQKFAQPQNPIYSQQQPIHQQQQPRQQPQTSEYQQQYHPQQPQYQQQPVQQQQQYPSQYQQDQQQLESVNYQSYPPETASYPFSTAAPSPQEPQANLVYTAQYEPVQLEQSMQLDYQEGQVATTSYDSQPATTGYEGAQPPQGVSHQPPYEAGTEATPSEIILPDFREVAFTDGPRWCAIIYHEYDRRVGDKFTSNNYTVTVDGFTTPMCDDRFSLGALSHVNRVDTTEWTRRRIGKGLRLTYVDGEVYVECLGDTSIFVSCPLFGIQLGRDTYEHVTKVTPGASFQVFSNAQFSKLLSAAISRGFETVYRLTNSCTFRISFVKGWGRNYKRQSIVDTPCWIEVQLMGPLQWIDRVLRQMRAPQSCGSTS